MKTIRILLAAVFTLHGCVSFADGVKWRGIFINDEDWSLRPWAVKHFGKEEQIGTNVYGMVFKLMKEHGLNLIWPAMHEGGYEFSSRPENFDLADKHDITVGTSHCEPMLRNNCYLPKSDKKKWSWKNNQKFLEEYWREGVRRGEGHNVMYTIGMRGIHDGRMPDGKTTAEKRRILEEVFAAQCAMLPEGAPKMFCPYKEVLPIFNSGLNVPKDATIMWTNDNFGYIRRLGSSPSPSPSPSPLPPQGIYWHISYHGHPHGYIHLCTTPPAFMWYELVAKCWENGVRDVWMVNAGDVFQAEILLDAFGRFAADPEVWKTQANPQREALKHFVEEVLFRRQDLQDSHDLYANPVNPVNPVKKWTLVLQFLPDFALWPGLGLSVDVRVNGGEAVNVKVPGNNANLGEHDKVRNAAVQDNFVRAVVEGVSLKDGDNIVEVVARDPGVVIDKVGVLPFAR